MAATGSTISLTVDGVEISQYTLFAGASFEWQLNAVPGTCQFTVSDRYQDLSFATGDEIVLTIDGVRMWGGYALQVNRKFALPADDTTVPTAVETRQYEISGVDYNILFDKRIIHNSANHTSQIPNLNLDHTMGQIIVNHLAHDSCPKGNCTVDGPFLDIADDGIDVALSPTGTVDSTFVPRFDDDGNPDPDGTKPWAWPTQGTKWRDLMDEFSQYGTIYYIDADKSLHFHEAEDIDSDWGFSDKPNFGSVPNIDSTYPLREFEEVDDIAGMVNEAFVWGGSEWSDDPSKTKFFRTESTTSVSTHNLWQYAETRFGDLKTLRMVKARARVIVFGNTQGIEYTPGSVGGDTSRGLAAEQHSLRCVWFGHDVPKIGGNRAHIRPGYVSKFVMYVLSANGVDPATFRLPLRSVRISFPNLDPTGKPYTRFEGSFGLQFSDPWWLWKFLRDTSKRNPAVVSVASGTSYSAPYGAEGSFAPTPDTDGTTRLFTIPNYSYISGTLKVYKNGQLVVPDDYVETDPAMGTFTLDAAPSGTDNLWVICKVAGGKTE